MIKEIKNVKMKAPKALTTLLLVLLTGSFGFAQSGFEGVITYNTTNAAVNETAAVKWYVKNGKHLMEFNSKAGDKQLNYSVLMNGNSETVVIKTDQGSQEVSGITGEEVFTSGKFIRKMDVKESGYNCEMLMFKSGVNDLVYWVTTEIGMTISDLPKLVRNNMPDVTGISDGIPVKMELRDAEGNMLRSQDLVSVEKVSVNDSKFAR